MYLYVQCVVFRTRVGKVKRSVREVGWRCSKIASKCDEKADRKYLDLNIFRMCNTLSIRMR